MWAVNNGAAGHQLFSKLIAPASSAHASYND